MATSTKCLYKGEVITIEFAIITKKTNKSAVFTCVQCEQSVRPHLGGGHTNAHFEHLKRNENCPLSHNSKSYKYSPPNVSIGAPELDEDILGEEAYYLRKQRTNQGIFRKRMFDYWGKCCISGITKSQFLIASHIKPWSKCTPEERLDPHNGLLLLASYDFLFDNFHLTFKDNGSALLSEAGKDLAHFFGLTENISIQQSLTIQQKKYLKYHRNEFNKKNTKI